jgi:peroxiredoxin (alkyl hydroperoxide reductase subunit C)
MGVLTGKKAPIFSVQGVVDGSKIEKVSLSDYVGNIVILFFYPLNFTFVCPTEIIAFQNHLAEFKARGVAVIGCSVDSVYSHLAWLNTPLNHGGIKGVTYTLISDLNREIAKAYDVLNDEGLAYRGLFLIDKAGIVRHQVVNDFALGRSVTETLRMVDSLIFHEECGESCPADWQPGQKGLKSDKDAESDFLESF